MVAGLPSASTSCFLYDGDALVGEYDSAGALAHRYVHGSNAAADDPLVQYSGAGLTAPRWLHADHLGSIVAATDASGGSPTINSYDEYGIPGWPPENIEEMAKKLEQEMLG